MTRFIHLSLCLILSLPVLPRTARADYFQYIDQDGTVVMVDDESKIPPQFRKKTRTTKAGPVTGSRSTSVRVRGNQALVPVRISYRNAEADVWLLMDTGASVTMISTTVADRLGIRPDSTRSKLSQVADGRVVETFRTNVDSLTVGPKRKFNSEIAILPTNGPAMGFDGLLGMDFLGEFRYHLDLNNQTIEWQ